MRAVKYLTVVVLGLVAALALSLSPQKARAHAPGSLQACADAVVLVVPMQCDPCTDCCGCPCVTGDCKCGCTTLQGCYSCCDFYFGAAIASVCRNKCDAYF